MVENGRAKLFSFQAHQKAISSNWGENQRVNKTHLRETKISLGCAVCTTFSICLSFFFPLSPPHSSFFFFFSFFFLYFSGVIQFFLSLFVLVFVFHPFFLICFGYLYFFFFLFNKVHINKQIFNKNIICYFFFQGKTFSSLSVWGSSQFPPLFLKPTNFPLYVWKISKYLL